MTKNEENWLRNYSQLKAYIEQHRHLPSKKKVENRGLLNWWKYNQRLIRQGNLDEPRVKMLNELSDIRNTPHPTAEQQDS